uniref:Uncharacterized protein n=1 Tax=Anguilla anguilla TaxID=7936 RepID=A0A0E9QW22_ANGAN
MEAWPYVHWTTRLSICALANSWTKKRRLLHLWDGCLVTQNWGVKKIIDSCSKIICFAEIPYVLFDI